MRLKLILVGCLLLNLKVLKADTTKQARFYIGSSWTENFSWQQPFQSTLSPIIYNYPHTFSSFSTLDISKFESNSRVLAPPRFMPISFNFGYSREIKNNGFVQVSLGLMKIANISTDNSRIRFSDQLDGARGFVKPTSITLESSMFTSQMIQLGLGLQKQMKSNHYITTGAQINRVVKSAYYLNIQNNRINEAFDFTSTDLTFQDIIWLPSVSLKYSYQFGEITSKFNYRIFRMISGIAPSKTANIQNGTFSLGLECHFKK